MTEYALVHTGRHDIQTVLYPAMRIRVSINSQKTPVQTRTPSGRSGRGSSRALKRRVVATGSAYKVAVRCKRRLSCQKRVLYTVALPRDASLPFRIRNRSAFRRITGHTSHSKRALRLPHTEALCPCGGRFIAGPCPH